MRKSGPNFKIKPQTKRTASTIVNRHERGAYLRMMIQAQLAEEDVAKQPLNKKDKE
jgi:hypothetical protein